MVIKCKTCKGKEFWQLNDKRLKCKRCRLVFTFQNYPFRLKPSILKKVIEEFLLEHSTNIILARVSISKYKLLKVLTLIRIAMTKDIPKIFSGIVEVDETYLGGQMKNRKLKERRKYGKNRKGFGTIKQPVFGILCRSGKVWAELVNDTEAKDLMPLIKKQVVRGSTVCSDSGRAYTGLVTNGYVHRLVDHSKKEYSDKKGHHINGLEGFWGYLKRKLAAKGGVRREKLPIYVGEYVWRYNHRSLTFEEQVFRVRSMLLKKFWYEN